MRRSISKGPEVAGLEHRLATIGRSLDRFVAGPRTDPAAQRDRWTAALDQPLPAVGVGADAVTASLVDTVVPNGARIADPGFVGFVTSGPTTMGVTAATAAHVAGPQRYTMTAFNHLEELSLRWLAELCGLGPDLAGVYSSGGSVANLVALGGARQQAFEQVGLDPSADGLAGRAVAVYASSEVHHTIQRAAGVLGIGRRSVRTIPVDGRQRMRPDALDEAIRRDLDDGVLPVAVVATAGTTNTGAIDPLRDLGTIAREHGIWFHVDGAYGLPGILDPRRRARFDGLELADSAIVDPHKWLGAPVGVGATFVRDRSVLFRAFTQEPADYLEGSFTDEVVSSLDHMGVQYADFGVELSAPSRGVQVWAIIAEEGADGIGRRVRRDIDHALRVTEQASDHPRLEALIEPELSVACLRYRAAGLAGVRIDELNAEILRRLVRETAVLPSATVVDGRYAIRPCFINVRTTTELVDELVPQIARLGDELTAG